VFVFAANTELGESNGALFRYHRVTRFSVDPAELEGAAYE
jgi:hypothetical protein